MAEPQSSPVAPNPSATKSRSDITSPRSLRQLGLFFAGAGFFGIATAITRRSVVRRYKATIPKFYQPSNRLNYDVNGAMEAFEALNIATINVISVGMMTAGGLLWAFDIASLEDMRRKVRTNIGVDSIRTDQDAEEELEEWFATVLARKEFKALRGEMSKDKDQNKDQSKSKSQEQEKKS